MKGIRGSLEVAIKLQFIGNDNPFRDSSAGVQFFTSSSLCESKFVVQEVIHKFFIIFSLKIKLIHF